MQACSSADGQLYTWTADSPDRLGILFPGPGSPLDVAIYASPVGTPGNNTNGSGAPILPGLIAAGTGQVTAIPSILTFAGGCVGWWDADHPGTGVTDGGAVTAPPNLIVGSNAVMAPAPGGTSCTYNAGGWRAARTQAAWRITNQNMRVTGSDVVNAANGLGASWMYIITFVPRITPLLTGGLQYVCGWDKLGAASFSNACGLSRTTSNRYTWSVLNGSTETADTAVLNQNAQMLEVSRPGGTQIQFGINNVRTAAVSWASGVTFNVDGFSVGGWAGGSVGNGHGDMDFKSLQIWRLIPGTTDLAAIYSFNPAIYSGFEKRASMGAT